MVLRVKNLGWNAGHPVAIINDATAVKLSLSVNDEVTIRHGSKVCVAVLEIIGGLVSKNEIALSYEVSKVLGVKGGVDVSVSLAPRPESIELIHKKLQCKVLSRKELELIIHDIATNALSEAEIAYFVSSVYECGMSLRETTDLTKAMVNTGKKLNLKNKLVVDKHSIGGVSGRITPVVVSICAAAGLTMPKTSSRAITSPSGTADSIETVCNVSFSPRELRRIIRKTNACFVWGGTLGFAPADDKLIQVEKLLSVDPEPQLLASILAKKLAVGAKFLIIDIPYGDNAKVSLPKAKILKRKFEFIGGELGITIKCVLDHANEPRGVGIGPVLEMIDVIKVLKCEDDGFLIRDKSLLFAGELLELSGIVPKNHGKSIAEELLNSGKAYKKFVEIIKAQGGSVKNFAKLHPGKFSKVFRASKSFTVKSVNIKSLNHTAIAAGCPVNKSAGIILHKHLGDKVKKGEPLITLYAETRTELRDAIKFFESSKAIN
ncbi:thymidine phosphorylase [Candidatus Pacearchaeota archaeon CG10_big_fil_rev_8_21_14_0_10_35_13]|nr:MAG: thymidine phosphorylase [Candidatus Pacearchaeota archaeon CG10_big_fil_rev_8_21_14_0_10_35_13]